MKTIITLILALIVSASVGCKTGPSEEDVKFHRFMSLDSEFVKFDTQLISKYVQFNKVIKETQSAMLFENTNVAQFYLDSAKKIQKEMHMLILKQDSVFKLQSEIKQ